MILKAALLGGFFIIRFQPLCYEVNYLCLLSIIKNYSLEERNGMHASYIEQS